MTKARRLLQFFIPSLVLGFVVACTGPRMEGDDPYRLQKISDLELCAAFGRLEDSLWGNVSLDQLEGELHRRDLFTKDEWILVRGQRIGKGMSHCSLLASWGPGRLFLIDEGSSDMQRYTYRSCRYCPRIDVEMMAGKVQGWNFPGNKDTYPKKKSGFWNK